MSFRLLPGATGGRPADFLSPECQEPPRRLKQRREQQQGGAEPDRQAEEQAKAGQEAAQRAALGQGLVARDQRRVKQHSRRSEEHTSELQSLMRISYAVFCLKKKNTTN